MQNINLKLKLKKMNENFDSLCVRHRKLEKSVEKEPRNIDNDLLDDDFISRKDFFKIKENSEKKTEDFEISDSPNSNQNNQRVNSLKSMKRPELLMRTSPEKKTSKNFNIDPIKNPSDFQEFNKKNQDTREEKIPKMDYKERLKSVHLRIVERITNLFTQDFNKCVEKSQKNCKKSAFLFIEKMKQRLEEKDPIVKTLFKSYKQ